MRHRSTHVRVASFNIKVATETALAHVSRDLCQLGADLCALQEVGAHWSMGPQLNQLAHLAAAQGHQATAWLPLLERSWSEDPYQGGPFRFRNLSSHNALKPHAGHFGIGLSAHGQFSHLRRYYLSQASDEQRGVLRVRWLHPHAPDRSLTVLCTHLSFKPQERRSQIEELIQLSGSISGPALLLGDFNDDPDSESLTRLYTAGWRDLYQQSTSGTSHQPRWTFSAQSPHRCLDYILGRGVTCTDAGIARDVYSSDHFPIWADLTW